MLPMKDVGLRRRLLLTALEVTPQDLHPIVTTTKTVGATRVRISGILNGEYRMRPAEFAVFRRIARRQLKALFGK